MSLNIITFKLIKVKNRIISPKIGPGIRFEIHYHEVKKVCQEIS
jgi:hypothetical protein